MDTKEPSDLGQPWQVAKQRVGTTPEARARWLWDQLVPASQATTRNQSLKQLYQRAIIRRHEWAAFLSGEGIPRDVAIDLASKHKVITVWKKLLKRALKELRTSGSTTVSTLRVERTWTRSESRITATCLPLNQSVPEEVESLVVTIALDCLARIVRRCHRPSCQNLFASKGKQKFCSKKCSLGVAKRAYRARKRSR